MTVPQVLTALRRGWWLLLIGSLVGPSVAVGLSFLSEPLYSARTQLFVTTTDAQSTADVYQGGQFTQQRVASYAQLLTGEELKGRVATRLGIDLGEDELARNISASSATGTVMLDVTVTDPSPERAFMVAEALGPEFGELVAELETPESATASPVKVTVVDRPELPSDPSSPQPLRSVGLGLLLGVIVGSAMAIGRSLLDRSVRESEEAEVLAGAPVIGLILKDDSLEKRHVVVRDASSRAAEDYRQLRTNLQFVNVDAPPRVLMVSSAVPSEGKTTVVVNLALALVDAGKRVTVIEADLRKPKVTRYLNLVGGAGLTNVLAGSAELDDVIQYHEEGGLSVLAAGPTPPNPGELLSSSHMLALVDELRRRSDFVLVDAPPLLPVADASGLAVIMDGVLLSVRYGSTSREQVRQAAATLDRVGARKLGVIMNIVPPKTELASGYGYNYSYGFEAEKGAHKR